MGASFLIATQSVIDVTRAGARAHGALLPAAHGLQKQERGHSACLTALNAETPVSLNASTAIT